MILYSTMILSKRNKVEQCSPEAEIKGKSRLPRVGLRLTPLYQWLVLENQRHNAWENLLTSIFAANTKFVLEPA